MRSKRRKNDSRQAAAMRTASVATCQSRWRLTGTGSTSTLGPHERRRTPQHVDHPSLLILLDPRPQREAEVLARGPLGLREVALGVAEVAQRGLQVERRRVEG